MTIPITTILQVLRHPDGHDEEVLRATRLAAADMLEQICGTPACGYAVDLPGRPSPALVLDHPRAELLAASMHGTIHELIRRHPSCNQARK